MGEHEADEHEADEHGHRDAGNTDPSELTEELTADELAEILARFESGHGVEHTVAQEPAGPVPAPPAVTP